MGPRALPTVDATERLREAAFALLVRDHAPVVAKRLAEMTGLSPAATGRAIAALASAGRLDVDSDGRVTGAAGLALANGSHRLTLGDAPFTTWCAYDALGIAGALEADALVETGCGQCGTPIALRMLDGAPDRSGPELLWLASGGDDLRTSFCAPTVLLCGREHGLAWAEAHEQRGTLLDLATAVARGARGWALCAQALGSISRWSG